MVGGGRPSQERPRAGRRASPTKPGRPPLQVVWDRRFAAYDFGPGHPFQMASRGAAVELLDASLTDDERSSVDWVREVPLAPVEAIEQFHRRSYLTVVRGASDAGDARPLDLGDTPSFAGCWAASCRVVGGTLRAIDDALAQGRTTFAPAGGLHHARPDRASGFCILNDLAVGIARAVSRGRRVAYVDLDAHHGDGVMYGFYDEGRVLDVDVHQDGRTLFPGTGHVHETGVGDGAGLKVNVPLPPGAGDRALVPLTRALLPPLFEEFRPDLLVVQHGVDGHWGDPLARLQYTPHGYGEVDRLLRDLAAARRCPVVITGGGGYLAGSVARALALAGRSYAGLVPPAEEALVPAPWRDEFRRTLEAPAPERWVDRPRLAPDPWSPDRTQGLLADLEAALGRRFSPSA